MRYFLLLLFVLVAGCGPTAPEHDLVASSAAMRFVYIPTDYQESEIRSIAGEVCGSSRICIAMFWRDRGVVPAGIPMSDETVKAKYAHYNLNKNSGMDRVLICSVDGC